MAVETAQDFTDKADENLNNMKEIFNALSEFIFYFISLNFYFFLLIYTFLLCERESSFIYHILSLTFSNTVNSS